MKKSQNLKNVYGFKVGDVLGSFNRWFSGGVSGTSVMTDTLREIMLIQSAQDFPDSYNYCKHVAEKNGFEFTELYESDFKKSGSPIKKLFKKIFK